MALPTHSASNSLLSWRDQVYISELDATGKTNYMKPLVLSEEFIVDSSDDEEPAVEERRTTPKTASNSLPDRSSVTCTKLKKQKTANPQEESSPESEPNGEDDHIDSDNDEEDNGDPPSSVELLDNSAAQATAKQSPRNRVKPRYFTPSFLR